MQAEHVLSHVISAELKLIIIILPAAAGRPTVTRIRWLSESCPAGADPTRRPGRVTSDLPAVAVTARLLSGPLALN
jgi:hypothetical protein